MHKPPLLHLRSRDNSRHLAELGAALSEADPPFNIRAMGGGEGPDGTGVFAVALDDDSEDRDEELRSLLETIGIEMVDVDGVTIELDDEPGALGLAAGVLQAAEINIESILGIGTHGDRPIILLGVPTGSGEDAHEALEAAGYFVYPHEHDHGDEGPTPG
jgi:hypothetical protein